MNVDDAMEAAKAYLTHEQEGEPVFASEQVAITLAKEVERLRGEVERLDVARLLGTALEVQRLRAELELSKANVQSLKKALFEVQEAAIRLGDQVDDAREELAAAKADFAWLRDRMKERVER